MQRVQMITGVIRRPDCLRRVVSRGFCRRNFAVQACLHTRTELPVNVQSPDPEYTRPVVDRLHEKRVGAVNPLLRIRLTGSRRVVILVDRVHIVIAARDNHNVPVIPARYCRCQVCLCLCVVRIRFLMIMHRAIRIRALLSVIQRFRHRHHVRDNQVKDILRVADRVENTLRAVRFIFLPFQIHIRNRDAFRFADA